MNTIKNQNNDNDNGGLGVGCCQEGACPNWVPLITGSRVIRNSLESDLGFGANRFGVTRTDWKKQPKP